MIPEEVLRLVEEFVYSDKVGMLILNKGPKTEKHPNSSFDMFLEETVKIDEMEEQAQKASTDLLALYDAMKVELHVGKYGLDRLRLSRKL